MTAVTLLVPGALLILDPIKAAIVEVVAEDVGSAFRFCIYTVHMKNCCCLPTEFWMSGLSFVVCMKVRRNNGCKELVGPKLQETLRLANVSWLKQSFQLEPMAILQR